MSCSRPAERAPYLLAGEYAGAFCKRNEPGGSASVASSIHMSQKGSLGLTLTLNRNKSPGSLLVA